VGDKDSNNATKPEPLPPFNTELIRSFQFGDPDGKNDDLLQHSALLVRGAREFLAGNKSIVLGERGAGKSALFKLLAEGKFKFAESADKQLKPMIVAIDDEMHYLTVANAIEERFVDRAKKATGKYLFLWEIFLLATVIRHLCDAYPGDVEISTLGEDLGRVLGVAVDKKIGIGDFFGRFKYSVGTKIDQATGTITPSFSVEPTHGHAPEVRHVSDHEISQFRDRVRKFIRGKKRVVYVLVDRVDDFVTDQAYDEQRKNVQALVDCIQNYRYPELKLKIFLRADIFSKLNFERGIDKIAHQVVRLEWSADDMIAFIARRLFYNYLQLAIKLPSLGISMALLDVDPSTREQLFDLMRSRPNSMRQGLRTAGAMFLVACKVRWSKWRKKGYAARKTNSLDEALRRLVALIFPNRVAHMSVHCKREELPIAQFLATHFSLGGQGPNPRLVLLFLQCVFEEAAEYYSRNPDRKSVPANAMGEYELILNEHVLSGYRRTQELARQTLAGLNSAWTSRIQRIFSYFKQPVECEGLTLEALRVATRWEGDDEEFHRFVAFFSHVGLLENEHQGTGRQYGDRTYCLPVVVRMCHQPALRRGA
jgi:hypothetical protein